MKKNTLNRKLIIIIQARLNSSRLKNKSIMKFHNEIILNRIIRICKKIKYKKNIYVLTGSKILNKKILEIITHKNIEVFFGSEENVFNRFKNFLIKKKIKKNLCLRITADNYLIQPTILNSMIKKFIESKSKSYYCYIEPLSHYAGELFLPGIILNKKKTCSDTKEHVTVFARHKLRTNLVLKNNFKKINHKLFFTLDTKNDLKKMKKLEKLNKFKNINCINEIKKLQKKDPFFFNN